MEILTKNRHQALLFHPLAAVELAGIAWLLSQAIATCAAHPTPLHWHFSAALPPHLGAAPMQADRSLPKVHTAHRIGLCHPFGPTTCRRAECRPASVIAGLPPLTNGQCQSCQQQADQAPPQQTHSITCHQHDEQDSAKQERLKLLCNEANGHHQGHRKQRVTQHPVTYSARRRSPLPLHDR